MASPSLYQGLTHGVAMAGTTAAPAAPRRDPHGRLPVPVALLTITGLSAGLWLGIVWLVATLL